MKEEYYKLCWFCDKKCFSFVSICEECLKEKQKKIHLIDKKNKKRLFCYSQILNNETPVIKQ